MRKFLLILVVPLALRGASPASALIPAPQAWTATDRPLPAEGYRIRIDAEGRASVEAADEAGRFYAGKTLEQLGKDARSIEIEDWPRYAWRGLHLDPARHFLGVEETKRFIDLMARYKFNILHWHLVDSEGWRLEIKAFPELTARGEFFTQGQVREILAFAAARHVRVVPEIEMPGHSHAALRTFPRICCTGRTHEKALVDAKWNPTGRNASVCPGKDATLDFFRKVLDEVCALFPGELVHIGGDECTMTLWKDCPDCCRRRAEKGLADEKALFDWFMGEMARYVREKGRRAVAWDDVAERAAPRGCVVMSWRGATGGIAAAKSGNDAVMCPDAFCYFDYSQGLAGDAHDYPTAWGTPLPLEKVYAFDPCAGVPAEYRGRILGGQANNWSEYTYCEADLQWKLWPRALAMAEALWTAPAARDFGEFSRRASVHAGRLRAEGVTVAQASPQN